MSDIWSADSLWAKAQVFADRAFNGPRDDDQFPFWCSLALELIARAALSSVSPTLLAETGDSEARNILHALGHAPKVKNFVPKSISTSDVFVRCEQLIPGFTKDLEVFARGFANKRNEELHTGGLPFDNLAKSSWQPRFYEVVKVLLEFQGKSLANLLSAEDAAAAEKVIQSAADDAAKAVRGKIDAHAKVWATKTVPEQADLTLKANSFAQPWKGHVVNCPSCGSKALLRGQEITQQPPVLVGDELVVRSIMLPTEFECVACGLRIGGHNELFAAGLGDEFINREIHDPVDYYAQEPDYEPEGFMNE